MANSLRTDWQWLKLHLWLILPLLVVSGNVLAVNVNIAWNASTSANAGGYKVYYGLSSGVYTSSIDVGKSTSYSMPGLQIGSTYYFAVTAYDLTKTVESSRSNEVFISVPAPPTADFTASQTNGNALLPVTFTPTTTGIITGWQWSFGDGTINSGTTSTLPAITKWYGSAGTYTVSLTVNGPGGSVTQTKSNLISVTSQMTSSSNTNSNGLVAAYGFDEASGLYVVDASGCGNYGTITGAIRVSGGHSGSALQFSGTSTSPNWVTVNNSPSLTLATGMTVEAWVYPKTWMSGGSTVVMKQQPNAGTYDEAYLLAANNNSANLPMSAVWTGSEEAAGGNTQIPLNQWTHLATTYDGNFQSLYVNGVLVDMLPQIGVIPASTGVLQIGGNSIWGGFFQGYIDEVRIYNQALNNAQIINDYNTAISVSNPPNIVAGDQKVEPTVLSVPLGMAQAFKITPQKAEIATSLSFYVDASSTATKLYAALYITSSTGHPYVTAARSALIPLQLGAWNSIPINPYNLSAGQTYWIGIMGYGGTLNLRGQAGSGLGMVETSAVATTALYLPTYWTTVSAYKGLVSAYESGY